MFLIAFGCHGGAAPLQPDGGISDDGGPADRCQVGRGGCDLHARCEDRGESGVTCSCDSGYDGDGATCAAIDACATEHGGCAIDATCTSTGPGERTCACNEGYAGDGVTCTAAALCAALPIAAAPDIGARCGTVVLGPNTCGAADSACAGNVCVTDNVEFREYCSVTCDPADRESCPGGFACVTTGCATGPAAMCVRSESTAAPGTCTEYIQGLNWRPLWFATLADGYDYELALDVWNGGAHLWGHAPGGTAWVGSLDLPLPVTWTEDADGPVEVTRVADGDGSTYVAFVTGVYRLALGEVTAQAVGGDVTRVVGVFRTPTGAIRALVDEPALALYERHDDATWTRLPAPAAGILRLGALADHGFVAVCAGGPCAGETGDDAAPIEVPAGVTVDELAQDKPLYTGASLAAYALVTRATAVLACHDHTCTRDALPAEYGPTSSAALWRSSGFVHTGATTFLYLGHAEGTAQAMTAFRRDGDCWRWISAPEHHALQWGAPDGAIHVDTGSKLCAVTP